MSERRHLHVGQIRAILERVLAVFVCDTPGRDDAALIKDIEAVLAEVAPDCPGCRAIHESYPTMRHFHHPSCPDRHKCAICGRELGTERDKEERDLRTHYGHQVGAICGECYHGKDAKDDGGW